MTTRPYIPPHAKIAAWCKVSLQAVRRWASGVDAVAHHYLVTIAEHDPRVDLDALTRWLAEKWREKHNATSRQ